MDNKLVYAILVFLFNQYGVVSLLNGKTKKCIFTILSGIITFGIVSLINWIKGILVTIKILQMSDEEFAAADKAALEDTIVLFYKD
ncbi:MAG: hypothetical protein J6U87_01665 [Clostridia bacterium]|nr:hypothetical protein [Clostridia bacterium]